MKILTCVVMLLLAGVAVDARDLTLSQAIGLAQQHSFARKKAQLAHEAAIADWRAARAERFPTISAAGIASYVSEVPQFTLQVPLGNQVMSFSRDFGTDQTYQLDVRVNLPLYTGGRIGGGIDLADAARQLNEALESGDSSRLIYITQAEYFGLYRAEQLVVVAKASRDRAGAISKNVSSLYEAGAADSVALLDVQLAGSRAGLAVSQAETNRRVAEIRLATLLGIDIAEGLTPVDTPAVPTVAIPRESVVETKPELRAAEANVNLSLARVHLARADLWPSFAVFGGYSYGKPNLDRFGNTWNDYFTVGASLNWSFNLGGRTANRTRSSRWTLQATQMDRDNVRETLIREANLAYEQLLLAFTRFQNSQTEYGIASDNYRLAQIQHSEGTLSSNRLLEIEAELTAAESSQAAALVDYYIAQSAYFYAIGSDNLRKGI